LALIAMLSSLAVAQSTRPVLVFVPEDSTAEGCFATEHVAAVIALTPTLRLVRGAINDGESLDQARARYGTDVAINGTRKVLATGHEEVSLLLSREQKKTEAKTATGPLAERTGSLLHAIWPKDLPALAEAGAPAAANAEALEAACAKDSARAYAASGAAIGPFVRKQLPPATPPLGKTLFARWAKASALARGGKCKEAVPMLREISAALAKNELAPTWRRAPREDAHPSALDLFGTTIVAFENGSFSTIDLATGIDRWRLEVGPSTPHLTDAGDGLVLAALQSEITALDLDDGRVRWRVLLRAPAPEIAQMGGRIFVGGEENVLALDRSKGEVVWRFDPLADMLAGPSVAGSHLALVAESAIILVDPAKGTEVKRIDLGDEISAPLTVTAKGSIWAMVGSDQIVLVDPETSEIKMRATNLLGAEWPPALASEQLVIANRSRNKRRAISYLEPSAKNGVKKTFAGAPPLLELPSFAGVASVEERPPAIVARDLDGAVLWRAAERQKITQLSREDEYIVAAIGSRVRVLEPKKGAAVAEVDFGEPVKQMVLGKAGGAVIVESGAIYGFPSLSDLRPKVWLREARLELGDCFLVLGQGAPAAATAKQLLERDPDDLDARALYAAAEEKTKPREAAERWLAVAELAPKNDALQSDAERALHALAGIDGPFLAATREATPPAPVFKIKKGETTAVSREGADKKDAWVQTFGQTEIDVLASSADYVVIIDSVERTNVHVIRAASGERVWMLPFGERITRASVSGDRVLFATEKRVFGVDAESGKEKYAVAVPAAELQDVIPFGNATAGGWIVTTAKKLRIVERNKGKILPALTFTSDRVGLAVIEQTAIVALADGVLVAVDLARGVLQGKINAGKLKSLSAGTTKIYAELDSGLLLSIDPAQGLRPAK
jgi:outer membrane protein assembly factor BamB